MPSNDGAWTLQKVCQVSHQPLAETPHRRRHVHMMVCHIGHVQCRIRARISRFWILIYRRRTERSLWHWTIMTSYCIFIFHPQYIRILYMRSIILKLTAAEFCDARTISIHRMLIREVDMKNAHFYPMWNHTFRTRSDRNKSHWRDLGTNSCVQ